MSNASFITTHKGGVGWMAVHVWWNPDGYFEPYQTGIGRYRTKEEAEADGRDWADAEDLKFQP